MTMKLLSLTIILFVGLVNAARAAGCADQLDVSNLAASLVDCLKKHEESLNELKIKIEQEKRYDLNCRQVVSGGSHSRTFTTGAKALCNEGERLTGGVCAVGRANAGTSGDLGKDSNGQDVLTCVLTGPEDDIVYAKAICCKL